MADISDWRGALGAEWADQAGIMERMLSPFGDAAAAALGELRGAKVLDLGCGGGASTFRMARRVGARGAAVGVDVSPDLIRLAAGRRAEASGLASRAGFLCADAATARFGRPFDALYSQFGAMFFSAPVAALANLRRAMRPDAPLSLVCWRAPAENEWAMLGLDAARPFLPKAPPTPRGAPGPFAWSDPGETFAPILARAGWRRVRWTPLDRRISLGSGMADDPVKAATAFTMKAGPLSRRLGGVGGKRRKMIRKAVAEAMEARRGRRGVLVAGAAWLVTAAA